MTDGGALYSQPEVEFDSLQDETLTEMLDQLEVSEFEDALGVAIDEIDQLEASKNEPRSSTYNAMLEHVMEIENGSKQSLLDWSKLTGDMDTWKKTNHDVVKSLDSEQQRLMAPVQESMNKAIEFQIRSQEIMAEVSVNMEYVGWIRSILSSVVKGIKRVITQT